MALCVMNVLVRSKSDVGVGLEAMIEVSVVSVVSVPMMLKKNRVPKTYACCSEYNQSKEMSISQYDTGPNRHKNCWHEHLFFVVE